MQLLKQSTTVTIQMGPALDKTDGVTEETALSPTVEISKNNAVYAARNSATAIAHDANGWYRVELNTTDTNTLGRLIAKFDDAATHLPVWHEFTIVPADVYDSLVSGTGNGVRTNVIAVNGTAQTAGDINGKIGTPSNLGGGATLSFNLSDIEAQTDDIGAAGAGLTAIPWNASWDAEVESEVNDALVVHRLDELLNADSDIDGLAPPTVGSVFFELLTKTTGSFTYDQTTDSLEAIRDNGDTAWVTKTDAAVRSAVGLAAANLDTQLTAIDDFIDTEVAAILTAVDTEVAAIKTVTDKLDTAQAEPSAVPAANETPLQKINFLFTVLRNKITITSTKKIFYNDAEAALWEKDLSDDGTTYTESEGNLP